MSTEADTFLGAVRSARPPQWPPAGDWVDSDRGDRVLQAVLAADRAALGARGTQRRGARAWAGPRLALAACVVVVAVVAVSVAVILSNHESGQTPGVVASTQSTAVTTEQVTKLDAIVDLLPAFRLKVSVDATPSTAPGWTPSDEAVTLGLASRDDVAGPTASKPITQGQYAILIVSAFGTILSGGSMPERQIDPQASPGERAAIQTLITSGILLPEDGTYLASKNLTKSTEGRLLSRVEAAYHRFVGE
jgi:hypothetical protein